METRLLTEVEIVRGPPPPPGTPLLPRGKERPVGLETVIEKRSSLLPPSSLASTVRKSFSTIRTLIRLRDADRRRRRASSVEQPEALSLASLHLLKSLISTVCYCLYGTRGEKERDTSGRPRCRP